MRVLYIGGTGEISLACVEEAARAGHEVTVFNRGQAASAERLGLNQVTGDFSDDEAYASLGRQDFDVICQFLAFQPEDVERDIRDFSGRCRQYIFISTASAYIKPLPIPLVEATPLGNPFWAYSRAKVACERRLMQAHRAGDLPVTIVRPSHTYHSRFPSPVIPGDHLVWRLLNGKPVIAPGDGESVWTVTHAADFARAFVQLCGDERALGEAFHITDSGAHTWNEILRRIGGVIGRDATVRHVLSKTLAAHNPAWEGPLLGDKSNSMILDNRKIADFTGGWRCAISLQEGLERVWPAVAERLASGYQPDAATDALIDRIVADPG